MTETETPWTDEQWLQAIWRERDPQRCVELMLGFYRDADRADRTSREQMYLHLGMQSGLIMRLLDQLEQPR